MPKEESLQSLDSRVLKQIKGVRRAIDQGDMDYARDVCISILERHPGCVEVRKLLRTAHKPYYTAKGLLKWIVAARDSLCLAYAALWLNKNPLRSLALAESVLCYNAENYAALRLLGRAAGALEFYRTAVMAYQAIQDLDPSDPVNTVALGNAHLKCDESSKAVALGQKALELDPADQAAQDLLKAASVALSLKQGSWDNKESFNAVKSQSDAFQSGMTIRERFSREKLRELIQQAEESVTARPDILDAYQKLADYHCELEEFDRAIAWIKKARSVGFSERDHAELERLESELVLKKMSHSIAEKEVALRANLQDEKLRSELQRAKTEEQNYRFKQAQAKVNQYPNEGAYRFELGVLLYERRELDPALRQFQRSQHSAKVRLASLLYLGRIYKAKTFFDLAIEQLQLAQSESPTMNALKKDITYELASCYELTGDRGKAIAEYKMIYAADINYRDVAEKINLHYAKQ